MGRTTGTRNGHRKSGRAAAKKSAAAKKKQKQRCTCGCGTLIDPDRFDECRITSVTIEVYDKAIATFASIDEARAYLQAGGEERVAAALAAGAGAHVEPDGGPRN